jgi:hypothetical protein
MRATFWISIWSESGFWWVCLEYGCWWIYQEEQAYEDWCLNRTGLTFWKEFDVFHITCRPSGRRMSNGVKYSLWKLQNKEYATRGGSGIMKWVVIWWFGSRVTCDMIRGSESDVWYWLRGKWGQIACRESCKDVKLLIWNVIWNMVYLHRSIEIAMPQKVSE